MSHAIIYLIFHGFHSASSLLQGSGGRQWWRNGGPTVEVEPKHRGGEKNKSRSFGVPGTAGTNFCFRENIRNIFMTHPRRATAKRAVISARFAAHRLNSGFREARMTHRTANRAYSIGSLAHLLGHLGHGRPDRCKIGDGTVPISYVSLTHL